MDTGATRLAPQGVSSLRAETAGVMQRSLSEDIREEREELREAAEQTLNIILDLNLDGTIRWASPSWLDVLGTPVESVEGTSIADLVVSDDKDVFARIVDSLQADDTRSRFVRFAMKLGPLSKLLPLDRIQAEEGAEPEIIDLEAQGIMVYDGASGGESHVSRDARPSATGRLLTKGAGGTRPCG